MKFERLLAIETVAFFSEEFFITQRNTIIG